MKLNFVQGIFLAILINMAMIGLTMSLVIFLYQTNNEDNKDIKNLTEISYRLDRKIDNTTNIIKTVTEDDADFNIVMLNNMSQEIQDHEATTLAALNATLEFRDDVNGTE